MSKIDKTYQTLLEKILYEGYNYSTDNRKNVVCKQIDHFTVEHKFTEGFPLLTLKKIPFNLVVSELLWFLRGDSSLEFLQSHNNHIWDKDAATFSKSGMRVGKSYGKQWRYFTMNMSSAATDQIATLVNNLRKENPINRRHLVTAWNPSELEDVALPPCHWSFEIIVRPLTEYERQSAFYVKATGEPTPKYGFTLKWNQRTVDTYLGLPFNIASYALLALLIERWTGHVALGIIGNLSNVHLYDNSLEAAKELLKRDADLHSIESSVYLDNDITKDSWDIYEIRKVHPASVHLINYFSYPNIKVEMLAQDVKS